MALEWSKDMEIGNHQIDREHRQLVDKVNEFYVACQKGKGKEEMLSILRFLKQYTVTHFAHEEKLQMESHYPDFARHRRIHNDFIQTVLAVEEKLEKEGPSVTLVVEINQKIGNWLINHIKKEDTKVGKHLLEQSQPGGVFRDL